MDYTNELKKIDEQKKLAVYEGEDKVIPAEELLKLVQDDTKNSIFYKTTFPLLDDIIGGFRRGQLVIISAATGQGKTSFAQTLTEKFVSQEQKCLWFTYEVGIEEFMEKMPEGGKAFHVPKLLKQSSLSWLRTRVIEGIAKYNTRIIFIDHLHYLLEMQKMAEAKSISLLIGMMLRDLKRLANEEEVLIFLITHIKKIDSSISPELEDLRDSSFVAQESDLVLMLWREWDKVDGEKVMSNRTKISVKKNRRTGKLGTVCMEYVENSFIEIGLPKVETKQKDWTL